MGFPFPKFAFPRYGISGFILRKERAVYIINSYYMKISLARLLKRQKISMLDLYLFQSFNRVSRNIYFLMPNRIGTIRHLP